LEREAVHVAVLLGNLYRALVTAGGSNVEAQKAAEEVAGFEGWLAVVECKVSLLPWMVGLKLAVTMGIAIKPLVP
jgi:hypothetical protein